ncbi:MAG: hypothetical protein M1812_004514 [Candelaria pacifica]|nr:MAG: hypothetical protein M1812_004514 [Candelaria pacifica]
MPALKHITTAVLVALCSRSILALPVAQQIPSWGDISVNQDGDISDAPQYAKREDTLELASSPENIGSSATSYVPGSGEVKLGPHGESPPNVEDVQGNTTTTGDNETPLRARGLQARDVVDETAPLALDTPSLAPSDVPGFGAVRVAPDGESPPNAEDLLANTTIAGGTELPSSYVEETSRIEKRENHVMGSYSACAMGQQKNWPKQQLTKAQSEKCSKIPKSAKRAQVLGAPGAVMSADGKYQLAGTNCGDNRVLKNFLFGSDFKIESDKICAAMLCSGYDCPAELVAPGTKSGLGNIIGSWHGQITARRKIAQTIWHVSSNKVGIYTALINYALKGNKENHKLAMDLCKLSVDKVGSQCVLGIGAIPSTTGDPNIVHQAQKAATATWLDAKSNLPAIAFEYSFYN